MIGLGRLYSVVFENQSFTTANADYDYFELIPATNKPICLEALYVYTTTEVGDAQEEQVRWSIVRGNTTSGNGSSATPAKMMEADSAAAFTAETVASTPATTAGTTVHVGAFNIRIGLEYCPVPEHRVWCSAAESRLCIRQLSTLADDASMSGTVYVREFG